MKTIFQMRIIAVLVLAAMVLFAGCKKDNNDSDNNDNNDSENVLPVITSFAPTEAVYSTTLTIKGKNFSEVVSENNVTLNGVNVTVTSATTTELKVVVPKNKLCSGPIQVTVAGKTAISSVNFTYVLTATTVITIAGSTQGYANGVGNIAKFNGPTGITIDVTGNLYVTDYSNHCIRMVTPTGVVTTIAGSGAKGYADGTGTAAKFNGPYGITFEAPGNLYVADDWNHCIRKVTLAGVVTTLAGNGTADYADGTGTAARFYGPSGIAIDVSGNLYVADGSNQRIRKVTPTGVVTTIAGSTQGYADGTGTAAKFYGPYGILVDVADNLYVADKYNDRIRKVTPTGVVSTLSGSSAGYANGTGTAAKFDHPDGIAMDASGNLYIADSWNNCIRKMTPAGVVSTVAGSTEGYADGGIAIVQFNHPSGIAIDASGNLYVADDWNHRIRKITME